MSTAFGRVYQTTSYEEYNFLPDAIPQCNYQFLELRTELQEIGQTYDIVSKAASEVQVQEELKDDDDAFKILPLVDAKGNALRRVQVRPFRQARLVRKKKIEDVVVEQITEQQVVYPFVSLKPTVEEERKDPIDEDDKQRCNFEEDQHVHVQGPINIAFPDPQSSSCEQGVEPLILDGKQLSIVPFEEKEESRMIPIVMTWIGSLIDDFELEGIVMITDFNSEQGQQLINRFNGLRSLHKYQELREGMYSIVTAHFLDYLSELEVRAMCRRWSNCDMLVIYQDNNSLIDLEQVLIQARKISAMGEIDVPGNKYRYLFSEAHASYLNVYQMPGVAAYETRVNPILQQRHNIPVTAMAIKWCVTHIRNGQIVGLEDDGEIQPYSLGVLPNNILAHKLAKYAYRGKPDCGSLKYIGYVRPKEMAYYVIHYVIDGTDTNSYGQNTYDAQLQFKTAEQTGYKVHIIIATALPFLVELGYIEPRYAFVVKMKTMICYEILARFGDDFEDDFDNKYKIIKSTLDRQDLVMRATTFRNRLHVFHKLEQGEIVYFPGGSRSQDWIYYNHEKYAQIIPIKKHFAIVIQVLQGELKECQERFFPGIIIQNILGEEKVALLGDVGSEYFYLLNDKMKMFYEDLPDYLKWENDKIVIEDMKPLWIDKREGLQTLKKTFPMEQIYINFRNGLLMWENMLMVPCMMGCRGYPERILKPKDRVDSYGENSCWGGIMSIFDG